MRMIAQLVRIWQAYERWERRDSFREAARRHAAADQIEHIWPRVAAWQRASAEALERRTSQRAAAGHQNRR